MRVEHMRLSANRQGNTCAGRSVTPDPANGSDFVGLIRRGSVAQASVAGCGVNALSVLRITYNYRSTT